MKDESGNVSFVKGAPAIARKDGAARAYFNPHARRPQAHKAGVYLIGRVVTFEDPITVGRASGARDPHERRLALAHERRARLAEPVQPRRLEVRRRRRGRRGEGRLRRDPVRLRPLPERRRPLAHPLPRPHAAADEGDDRRLPALCGLATAPARRARLGRRLRPLGHARPRHRTASRGRSREVVDAIYPMTYPSHYRSGEYNLDDPNAAPGATVKYSLRDFRTQLAGGKALLVPWLQDFSLGRHVLARRRRRADRLGRAAATPAASCSGTPAGSTRAEALRGGAAAAAAEPAGAAALAGLYRLFVYALGYGEPVATTRAISLRTEIPGPESREILERKAARRRRSARRSTCRSSSPRAAARR